MGTRLERCPSKPMNFYVASCCMSCPPVRAHSLLRPPRQSPACPIAESVPFSSAVHGHAAGYGGRGTSLSTLSSRHYARGGNTFSYPTFCLAPRSSGGELLMIPTFLACHPHYSSTSSGSGECTRVCHPSNPGPLLSLLPGITGSQALGKIPHDFFFPIIQVQFSPQPPLLNPLASPHQL
jgi:hypothetical protein